jgi:hypothetical protein
MEYPHPLLRIQPSFKKSVYRDAAALGYLMFQHHLHQHEHYGLTSWSLSVPSFLPLGATAQGELWSPEQSISLPPYSSLFQTKNVE